MTDDFYEDDEELTDVVSAFRQGERGTTQGTEELSDSAMAIVALTVEELAASTQTIVTPFVSFGDVAQPMETTGSSYQTTTGELVNA